MHQYNAPKKYEKHNLWQSVLKKTVHCYLLMFRNKVLFPKKFLSILSSKITVSRACVHCQSGPVYAVTSAVQIEVIK